MSVKTIIDIAKSLERKMDIGKAVQAIMNIDAVPEAQPAFMPVMTGVTGYFDYTKGLSSAAWLNQIGDANIAFSGTVSTDANGARVAAGSYGTFSIESGAFPKNCTIYAVVKAADVSTTSWGQYFVSNYYNPGECGVEISSGWDSGRKLFAFRSTAETDLVSSVSALDYHLCTMSIYGDTAQCYVDGVHVGARPIAAPADALLYLGRRSQSYDAASAFSVYDNYYKFLAFAEEAHTLEEVMQNVAWIVPRYVTESIPLE